MEQKKILTIIAAVGVFLLVVLGAACILYSPGKMNSPVVTSVAPVEKKVSGSQSGWANPSDDIGDVLPPSNISIPQDVVTIEANEVILSTENTTIYETNPYVSESVSGTTIDLNALKESALQSQNINVNVTVKKDSSEVKREYTEPVKQISPAKTVAPKVEEKKTVKAAPSVTPKTVTAKSTPAKTTAKPAPAPAKVEEAPKPQFFVQVAAYGSKKGAETARNALDANKIPADIFTYTDAKNRLFYRVRVGPYTTKSEAEYWRQKIVSIPEFANEGSYITAN